MEPLLAIASVLLAVFCVYLFVFKKRQTATVKKTNKELIPATAGKKEKKKKYFRKSRAGSKTDETNPAESAPVESESIKIGSKKPKAKSKKVKAVKVEKKVIEDVEEMPSENESPVKEKDEDEYLEVEDGNNELEAEEGIEEIVKAEEEVEKLDPVEKNNVENDDDVGQNKKSKKKKKKKTKVISEVPENLASPQEDLISEEKEEIKDKESVQESIQPVVDPVLPKEEKEELSSPQDQSKQEIANLQLLLGELNAKLGKEQFRVKELEQEVSIEKSNMAALRGINEQQINKIKELDIQHHQQMSLINHLTSQTSDTMRTNQQLAEENRSLKETAAKTARLLADESELKQKVKYMDDALRQDALRYNASENARKTLELREKQFKEDLNKLQREVQMVNQRLKEELQRSQNLTNELQRSTGEKQYAVSQLESSHNAVQSRLHDSEVQKANLESQLKLFDAKINELVGANLQKDYEIQNLQKAYDQLTTNCSLISHELHISDATRSEVQAQLEQALADRAALNAEEELQAGKDASLAKELDDLREKYSNLEKENAAFKEVADNLRALDEERNRQLEELESSKRDLQSQLIQTQANQTELDKSAEKLTRLHEELNHQLDLTVVKQKELEKQQSENAQLQQKIAEMKSELLRQLSDSDARMRDELNKKNAEIQTLNETVKRLESDSSKNQDFKTTANDNSRLKEAHNDVCSNGDDDATHEINGIVSH